jgi:hypothetical protein
MLRQPIAHSATAGGARGRDDGWVFNGWFSWLRLRARIIEPARLSGFYAVVMQDDRWRHLCWNKSSKIFEAVQFK